MLIICKSIQKKELIAVKRFFNLQSIKRAAFKAKKGLGNIIPTPIKNAVIIKVYLTGNPVGRICFLVFSKAGDVIPLVIKLKKDKKIGNNMSTNNPDFNDLLAKNIKLALKDIENGDYVEYELDE